MTITKNDLITAFMALLPSAVQLSRLRRHQNWQLVAVGACLLIAVAGLTVIHTQATSNWMIITASIVALIPIVTLIRNSFAQSRAIDKARDVFVEHRCLTQVFGLEVVPRKYWEPAVLAFWSLKEPGENCMIHDYHVKPVAAIYKATGHQEPEARWPTKEEIRAAKDRDYSSSAVVE